LPTPSNYSTNIMTRKTNKLVAVDANPDQNLDISIDDNPEETLTLEQIVADELLDNIDWKAVKQAVLAGIQRKFIRWFVSGNASFVATNEIEAQAVALAEPEDQAA
jgi:hypothetical protein